jgi:hypothetical protein
MKIPDGWFQRLLELGKRAKTEFDVTQMILAGSDPEAIENHLNKTIGQYAAELQALARELQAESEKERRAAKVAELAAVILSGTLLGSMDREAVIKAAAVARQLLDEAAGVKELSS